MACPWWDDNYKELVGPEYRSYSALKDAFSSYRPLGAEIVVDRETGRSRGFGFGFVQFEDKKSMDDAIQGMNGQEVGGRNITVSQANQRPRRWKA
ncbi:hypothetical protein BS78_09G146400 [Paspalum vaginatum]|nr:hypothetical protein BS78_09G146400 [Paspalum vaginatum]